MTRRQRLLAFVVFALAMGAVIAHEFSLPEYCLRVLSR